MLNIKTIIHLSLIKFLFFTYIKLLPEQEKTQLSLCTQPRLFFILL